MTISAAPANNYTSNWTTVDTGSMTLKFGDATNDEAKSAYSFPVKSLALKFKTTALKLMALQEVPII